MKLLSILSIGLLLLALSAIHAEPQVLKLLPETTSPGGRCMDGSMAGYYIRDGDPDLFVINLQGGGSCYDKKMCDSRNGTHLGSSNDWKAKTYQPRFQNSNCTNNPVFCNATTVHIPYCTSDTHRGSRDVPSDESFGYYFDGHLNFKAIIEVLIAENGLAQADKVLFTGNSAGGVGVNFNINWLADRLPGVIVKGIALAGWFFPAALEDDLPAPFIPSNFSNFAQNKSGNLHYDVYLNNQTLVDIWQIGDILNEDCLTDLTVDFGDLAFLGCTSAHYNYPYIKSPLFNIHSQYDTNQLFTQAKAPKNPSTLDEAYALQRFVKMWGEATRTSFQRILNNDTIITKPQPDGIFSTSCFTHGNSETTLIEGMSYMDIANDWFTETGDYEQYYRLIESCPSSSEGLPCNSQQGCEFKTIADNLCSIDEFIYNRTFYIPAFGRCLRLQVFDGGTLEADTSDPGCNSDVFNSAGVLSVYANSTGNVATFDRAPGGYRGSIAFEQDKNVNDLKLNVISLNQDKKQYSLGVTLPSCLDPAISAPPSASPSVFPTISPSAPPSAIPSLASPSPCLFDDLYGKTIYVPAVGNCWRVQVFDGGTLEADPSDPKCRNTGSFNSAGIFSNYESGSGNSFAFEKEGTKGYFGTFSFEELSSISKQQFGLESWDPLAKEYDIIITFPNCKTGGVYE